jgi:hypothetical protein
MKLLKSLIIMFMSAFVLIGCDDSNDDASKGRIEVAITDAPIDDENVTALYLSIAGVELKTGEEEWTKLGEFDEPVVINLLDYQNGEVFFLTEESIDAGEYSEIRLILNMPEGQGATKANAGTYLEYADGTFQPLFVPSGATSGYKAKGEFTVPAGGVTGLTIDFDVRKSVVKAGNSGKYILKPVLRLLENNNVAMIKGNVISLEEYATVKVFAYKNDTFTEDEITEPASDDVDFPNAVTSANVDESGNYTLAFMEPGTYDIYAVAFDEAGEYIGIIDELQDVSLEAGEIEEVILEEVEETPEG